MVSGRSFWPAAPLACVTASPDAALTSVSRTAGSTAPSVATAPAAASRTNAPAAARARVIASPGDDQPLLDGVEHELGGLVDLERAHQVRAVHGHGVHAEA